MKFLIIMIVAMFLHVAFFIISMTQNNVSTLMLAFCSLTAITYPALVVALYRAFSGRAESSLAIITPHEKALLAKYRHQQKEV